jgi:DNA-binding NarL/FixJ family response regulator
MRPMRSVAGYTTERTELTPRMRDVLASAAAGNPTKVTALQLHVSESTVWALRAAACARLEASNITAAVYIAARRGELPWSSPVV